jgi:hypothetical protein
MRVNQLLLVGLLSFGVSALCAQAPPRPAAAPAAATKPTIELTPPREKDGVRFAIIGDSGTGDRKQYEIGAQMTKAHQIFPSSSSCSATTSTAASVRRIS